MEVRPVLNLAAATVSPAVVTFDAASWSIPQRVDVVAPDDLAASLASDNSSAWLLHRVSSDDDEYDGAELASIAVSVADNDFAAVVLREEDGSTQLQRVSITEGSQRQYTVALLSQPADQVEVHVSASSSSVDVQPASLVFAVDGWDAPQAVVLTAATNQVPGRQECVLRTIVQSADPIYAQLLPPSVRIQIIDDDFFLHWRFVTVFSF